MYLSSSSTSFFFFDFLKIFSFILNQIRNNQIRGKSSDRIDCQRRYQLFANDSILLRNVRYIFSKSIVAKNKIII